MFGFLPPFIQSTICKYNLVMQIREIEYLVHVDCMNTSFNVIPQFPVCVEGGGGTRTEEK